MAEEKLNIEDEETPLQGKLEAITNQIGKIGVYVATVIFIVMTIKLVIITAVNDSSVSKIHRPKVLINFSYYRI